MLFTMYNLDFLKQLASIEDLARNYRALFDKVKATKKPLVILKRNVPEVAVVDISWLQKVEKSFKKMEEERVLGLVETGRKELKKGKTKVLKSIDSLMDKYSD